MARYPTFVPEATTFNMLEEFNMSYMVFVYLPGVDAEPYLTDEEQYVAGICAGRELKKMHALAASSNIPDWFETRKKKSDKHLTELKEIQLEKHIKDMLETYIKRRNIR